MGDVGQALQQGAGASKAEQTAPPAGACPAGQQGGQKQRPETQRHTHRHTEFLLGGEFWVAHSQLAAGGARALLRTQQPQRLARQHLGGQQQTILHSATSSLEVVLVLEAPHKRVPAGALEAWPAARWRRRCPAGRAATAAAAGRLLALLLLGGCQCGLGGDAGDGARGGALQPSLHHLAGGSARDTRGG